MLRIQIELFTQAGVCSCGQKLFREQVERIREDIEGRYPVELDIVYLPVGIKRAWDLGVSVANSAVVNERLVLEGGYTAEELSREMEQEARRVQDG